MPPENTNSVLVACGGNAAVFDPWGRADDWSRLLAARGLQLLELYATHAHPDHISAAPGLAAEFGVPLHVATADGALIGWGGEILDFFGLSHLCADCLPTVDIAPGRHMVLGDIAMDVIASPGHTPGGRMFYFPNEKILLTGDTLFRDGFGRYDFPGGDADALAESISNLYKLNLPDDAYVVHGHGNDSTIESLRCTNPYFKKL